MIEEQISEEELGDRLKTMIDLLVPTVSAEQVMSPATTSAARRRPVTRYRVTAFAWLAVVAVLVAALVIGVHVATAGKTKQIAPAATSPSSTYFCCTTTIPHHVVITAPPVVGSTTPTTEHVTTQTTLPRITTTVPLVPLSETPLFIAGPYTGREPGSIGISGDAGNIIINLEWSSWSTTGAVGHGTSNYLTCVPNCAAGPAYPEPTTITLSDPVDGHFTKMVELKMGYTSTYTYPRLWAEEAAQGQNL
ncbi:MAG: hypothetical protein WAM97_23065 [Acidimicrobiales bacterium]